MTTKHKHDNPILVTGAAGAVAGIGRNLTEFLLARGHKVRALVRREDERAEALRRLGAEVVQGDLTDLGLVDPGYEEDTQTEPSIWVGNGNGSRVLSYFMSSPALQGPHWPHEMKGWTMTVSPTETLDTADPISCTQPAFS